MFAGVLGFPATYASTLNSESVARWARMSAGVRRPPATAARVSKSSSVAKRARTSTGMPSFSSAFDCT